MKLHEVALTELSYPKNIGAMEMVKFHQVASVDQKNAMKRFLNQGNYNLAWALLQKVTGVKLHSTSDNMSADRD